MLTQAVVLYLSLSLVVAQEQDPVGPPARSALGFDTLPSGMRAAVVPITGSNHVALTALLPVGGAHDPADRTGFAAVMEAVLQLQQEEQPEQDRLTVEMRERTTVFSGVFPAERLPAVLRNLNGMLGEQKPSDGALQRAKARTLLEIDDATHVYPGPILRWRAQQVVFTGTALGRPMIGIPAEVEAITTEEVAQRTRAHYAPGQVVLAVVGAPAETAARGAIAEVFAGARRGEPAAMVSVPPTTEIVAETVHDRVDAPFVTLAFSTPSESLTDDLPFVIALQIVNARAARAFGEPRQGEMQARFRYMFGSFWEGSRLVLLNRRGRNGDELQAPRSEIEALLFGIRDRGLSTDEISAAAVSVGHMLMLPPYPEDLQKNLRTQPRLLQSRAFVLATAELLGWPGDLPNRVGAVLVGDVQKALMQVYNPARWHWLALVPK